MSEDEDVCRFCGSLDLWANFFDRRGFGTNGENPADQWRVLCASCGNFQDQRRAKR